MQSNNKSDSEAEPKPQALQRRSTMSMSNGLLQPKTFEDALEFARIVAYSGMVPAQYDATKAKNDQDARTKVGAALVAMQYGAELGLTPLASLQSIASINGMPSVYGDAFWALITSHADFEDASETLDTETMTATCTIKRRDRSPVVREFSMVDAKAAGLSGKQGPWSQYPKRMLQMRARTWAGRDAFPDATRGIRTVEEARDIEQVPEYLNEPGPPEGIANFRQEYSAAMPEKEPVKQNVEAEKKEVEQEPKPDGNQQQGLGW